MGGHFSSLIAEHRDIIVHILPAISVLLAPKYSSCICSTAQSQFNFANIYLRLHRSCRWLIPLSKMFEIRGASAYLPEVHQFWMAYISWLGVSIHWVVRICANWEKFYRNTKYQIWQHLLRDWLFYPLFGFMCIFYESEELVDCHLTLFFRVGSGNETTVQNVAHFSADTFLEHARLISLECGWWLIC